MIEIKGEWADDSIMVADVKKPSRRSLFGAAGHVTDLTWTPDSEKIIYCAAGQAYRLEPQNVNSEPLPFGAELCACHPHLPRVRVFQFVAEKFGEGPSFSRGSEPRRLFSTNIRRKAWQICDGARMDRRRTR